MKIQIIGISIALALAANTLAQDSSGRYSGKTARERMTKMMASAKEITDAEYVDLTSSTWCAEQQWAKNILYVFAFQQKTNKLSMCTIETPTYISIDKSQLHLDWRKDEAGNKKSMLSERIYIRKKKRVDVFKSQDQTSRRPDMVLIKTASGWICTLGIAEGVYSLEKIPAATDKRGRKYLDVDTSNAKAVIEAFFTAIVQGDYQEAENFTDPRKRRVGLTALELKRKLGEGKLLDFINKETACKIVGKDKNAKVVIELSDDIKKEEMVFWNNRWWMAK